MTLQTNFSTNSELVVTFVGQLDAVGIKSIRDKFNQLEQTQASQIVLDLHHVDLIDSSGIGAIVFLYKRMRNHGVTISLIGLHGQPKTLIKMLRIDSTMPVSWSNQEHGPSSLMQQVKL